MQSHDEPTGLLWRQWLRIRDARPRRIVLIDPVRNKSWSAAALTRHALALAAHLPACRPGTRVAFRLPNGADWLALFLALQRANLAAVPLDAALPAEGCRETARRLGAHALYLDGRFELLGKGRHSPGVCCLKITSGSAGLPKAVACRAGHLLADGRQVARTMGLRPTDRNLAAIPLGHSYGLGNLVLPLILQGTALVAAADYVPRQLVEWIGRYRVTVLPAVPALFRVLAELPPGPRLAPVRMAISAGAVLSPAVAQAFFARYGIKIHNFYGSSETGGICYDRTGAASLTGRSVGKPLAGVSLILAQGRLTVASPAVATRTGRWRPPDRAEWNVHGELVLLGRRGRQANIGGKKVHPLEIERVLRALPGVTDAAVWPGHRQGRDFLSAAVETALTRSELECALAPRLAAWKWPRAWLIARALPRTPRGKLDSAALQRQMAVSCSGALLVPAPHDGKLQRS